MHWQSRSRARQTTPIRGFGADASLQCNDTNQQCNDVILQCKTMTWTNALSCCYCCYCSSSESNSISSLAPFDSCSSSKTCIELSDQMMICQLAIVAEEAHCNQTSFQWSSFLIYKIQQKPAERDMHVCNKIFPCAVILHHRSPLKTVPTLFCPHWHLKLCVNISRYLHRIFLLLLHDFLLTCWPKAVSYTHLTLPTKA